MYLVPCNRYKVKLPSSYLLHYFHRGALLNKLADDNTKGLVIIQEELLQANQIRAISGWWRIRISRMANAHSIYAVENIYKLVHRITAYGHCIIPH